MLVDAPIAMRCARGTHVLPRSSLSPLTTGKSYPFRIATKVQGTKGVAAVDQVRTIDKQRLVKKIGRLPKPTAKKVLRALGEMISM